MVHTVHLVKDRVYDNKERIKSAYLSKFYIHFPKGTCKWFEIMGMCNGRKGQSKGKVKWTILDEFVEEVNEHTNPHSEPQVEIQKTGGAVKKA